MKSIFEYLLSRSKQTLNIERPTEDSSFDDIINWIKSYDIKKIGPDQIKPGQVGYVEILYENTKMFPDKKSLSFIKLISGIDNEKQQSVTIFPFANETRYTDINLKHHLINFDKAIDLMEQIIMNPKTIIKLK